MKTEDTLGWFQIHNINSLTRNHSSTVIILNERGNNCCLINQSSTEAELMGLDARLQLQD